ncbi:hypothetical protein MCAMS1_00529 [biofilm metagenome]
MFKDTNKIFNVLVSWWFLRGLGLIYLGAFASMFGQIAGLIGPDGILPLSELLEKISLYFPEEKFRRFPCIFWFDHSINALKSGCIVGMIAAGCLVINWFTRSALIVCYVLYLSLCTAGQDFTSFQWDIFLLESGFLAIFLTWHSRIIEFLYRLLVARFMLMGGIVKIASGDPTWANLTALNYHYLTQPLPSPLAYNVYFFPEWFHQLCTAGILFIELLVPICVFMPRPFRLFAAWSFIILQSSIILTGNYNFFNLLTLLLCLFLFEDNDLCKVTSKQLYNRIISQANYLPGRFATTCAGLWASVVILVLATQIWMAQMHSQPAKPLLGLIQMTSTFGLINNYGPFAVMTTVRNEVIIEGSMDGKNWREYEFKYKPGQLDKPLRWIIPHNPRLDWQLWFVPLGQTVPEWFHKFLYRLQQGSPDVLALLAKNPFPEQPPKAIRATLYQYDFVPPRQRAESGQLWRRNKGVIIASID